ncbi:YjcZ family sporulation protein [Brevibacillus sp. SYSU BS000544]
MEGSVVSDIGHCGNGFILVLVLFILLVIVGASEDC